MATQPIVPPNVPPGIKPIAPPTVPSAPGRGPLPSPAMAGKSAMPTPPGVKPAGPGQANPGEEEDPEHPHPVSFWQQPWVQNVLPFITSVSIHATLIIMGLLVWGVAKVVQAVAHQDQTIIPDAQLVENGPPGGVPNVGPGTDPNREALQDQIPDKGQKDGFSSSENKSLDLSTQSRTGDDASSFAGPRSSAGSRNGTDSLSAGTGQGGGALARFGPPGGGSLGIKGPVFGGGGNAHQIVFLCDATGSMLNKMATLKDELSKAIGGLKPVQSFDIVFYQDVKVVKFQDGMVNATPETKRKAGVFLDGVTAESTTDPIPSLEFALKLHPQLLFFLTDAADFPDPKAVTDTIAKYNKDKSIKINTILFVEDKTEHEKNQDSEGLMKGIATDSGGKFRWVEIDAINSK